MSVKVCHNSKYSGTASSSVAIAETGSRSGVLTHYWELTKPRLSFLSVITAIVGYMVVDPERNLGSLIALILGTSFTAGAAGTLNQWLEREIDARMVRTSKRPLPAGLVPPLYALLYGLVLGIAGLLLLALGNNLLTALFGLLTLLSYLLVYTPLKLKTPWCTHVGAIPGALPPLIGCAAAQGAIDASGWILFAILFAWQIPHFMAIAWTYRKDYEEGDFPMLTVVDPSGKQAAWHSLVFTIALVVASALSYCWGINSWIYLAIALASGGYFFWKSVLFARDRGRDAAAKRLFFASIFYLPLVLAAMVLDHWLLA